MKLECSHGQVNVSDNDSHGGVNINAAISGYAADMFFWGCAAYLARRKDDPFLRVVVVPSEKWAQDLRDDGYELLGLLSDLAKQSPPTRSEISHE